MFKKASVIVSGIVLLAALLALQALAAPTDAPDAADIDVVNNLTGTPDTVDINNVQVSDIIRVYSTVAGIAPVGVTVAEGTSATVSVNQLGTGEGIAYVTVTSGTSSESDRTPVPFSAEPKTTAPAAADITISNFAAGRPDLIVVQDLSPGDIVRVYQNSVSPVALAAAESPSGGRLFVNQLGAVGGSVYITVQRTGELESDRTKVSYLTETTAVLEDDDVEVVNNHYSETAGSQDEDSKDTVTVSGVVAGDVITIYKSAIGPDTWLPPLMVAAEDIVNGDVSLTIDQLGEKAGKIYVTITSATKAESKRKPVAYEAEPVSDQPVLTNITVTNNCGDSVDSVHITGLLAGDHVNIYATPVGLGTIGSNTVSPTLTEVTVTINPGLLLAAGGKIYVTVTSTVANESPRLTVPYKAEEITDGVSASQVTITNNYFISDYVTVKGLNTGDVVRIYKTLTGPSLLGTQTAAVDQVTFTISPGELQTKGGNLYVTVTSSSLNESKRTAVPYKSEDFAKVLDAKTITVTNNYDASDIVVVPGLKTGDVVKVYLTATGGTPFDPVTESGGTATVLIDDNILSAKGGKIYVTVTATDANESPRAAVTYPIESTSNPPAKDAVVVTNNYILQDTVLVNGLQDKDVVKIYKTLTGTELYAEATSAGTSLEITLDAGKLSATGGKIYVTVKAEKANESARATITYDTERSAAPAAKDIKVTNNFYDVDTSGGQTAASYDEVRVSGVEAGDIITIYKASGGAATWVSPVTVLDDGNMAIPVSQLGTKAGKIYVTVTEPNRSESVRTAVSFLSEPTTTAPPAADIIITNNYAAEDTVTISNLIPGQVVTIYSTAIGMVVLDTDEATGVSKTFSFDDGILSPGGGKLYITVRNEKELESLRTAQSYTSETTATPKAGNSLVVNYPGTAYDTVTITGLTPGDIVRIYTTLTGGTAQTTATVAGKGTTLTLDANLPDTAGTIYITVTNVGKAESKRIAVNYDAA